MHLFYFICEQKFNARTHENYATLEINPYRGAKREILKVYAREERFNFSNLGSRTCIFRSIFSVNK